MTLKRVNFIKTMISAITSPYFVNLIMHEIWNTIITNSSCMIIDVIPKWFNKFETYNSSDTIRRGVNAHGTLFSLTNILSHWISDKIFNETTFVAY